ncbi:MAG TPA: thiamine pyrophosphate-dependent enzyme [Saccharofermentans sp.]|jgi:2-oxoglutarate/2-oxoacid ferredoxin oxidoreductase subunit beta|nr:2-oxoglutarate oxidoreductase [Clostridia bacterium]NLX68093.1 2-oxoglutarate oxidoreductase [Clostridiaceae bacterium]HOO48657.1 thiamine pyrophosphate-dependent enzyme [Saccharofermentans sp.]HPE27739.1 thiamine pyrophosphate-dependent enzyme [Saccharofermentans sp.]HPG64694.1 thiamine pyrophosphate-dependent enzyme [Saccharofermentans sp.]
MAIVFERTTGLTDKPFHYCPGCTHGIIHRIIAETMVEMGILDSTVGVASVGCTYNSYEYFSCDMVQAAHGRAPAVATGIKRSLKDKLVFTYQGDGDLASIGTAEIIHAAARGEKICTFFVNNAVYGMTSGQMAPTTLLGQVTTTSPFGRDASYQGYPINVSELIAQLTGAVYVERVSLTDYKNVMKAKAAVKKAFEVQMSGKGFAFVEFLSTCPTNWGKEPCESLEWLKEKMIPQYPLGCFKGADLDLEVKS